MGSRNHVLDGVQIYGRGIFDGGHVPAKYDLATHGEHACLLHAVDECIRRR